MKVSYPIGTIKPLLSVFHIICLEHISQSSCCLAGREGGAYHTYIRGHSLKRGSSHNIQSETAKKASCIYTCTRNYISQPYVALSPMMLLSHAYTELSDSIEKELVERSAPNNKLCSGLSILSHAYPVKQL